MNMSHKLRQRFRHRVARGMTLIEILTFIALVVCAISGAKLGHRIMGSWYGWLLGGILGVIIVFVCICALGLVMHLWSGTGLPKCRNGCCRGPGLRFGDYFGDYDIQESGGEFYRMCKCGDRYQRRGKRFVLINEDGTETPYLIWRRFKGWSPDEGQK